MESKLTAAESGLAIETSWDAIINFEGDNWSITAWNQQAETLFEWSKMEVLGRSFFETIIAPEYRDLVSKNLLQLEKMEEQTFICERIEVKAMRRDGTAFPVEITIRPVLSEEKWSFHTYLRDISERKRDELVKSGQNQVFEMLVSGKSMTEILTAMIGIIEQRFNVRCSVLLIDEDGKHLRAGSAPSMPNEFNLAVDGLEIGPCSGSCGTAAYRCEPVVIEDIKTDPLWAGFRELGLQSGIRSCWSQPILSEQKKVLGTLCMYYREARKPLREEIDLMGTTAKLASIAIERRKAMTELENKVKEVEHFREMILARDERIHDLKDEIVELKSKSSSEPLGQHL